MTRCIWTIVLAAVTCLAASPARGQNAEGGDVAVGYSFMAVTDSDVSTLPVGWVISGSWRVNRLVSLAGQAAGNYRQAFGELLGLHTFMAGVRLSPARPGVRAFGEVLAGAVAGSCCNSATYFAIEPGGGVEFPFGYRTAARIGAGVPVIVDGGGSSAFVRVQASLVIKLARP